jgi:hypothetical protein
VLPGASPSSDGSRPTVSLLPVLGATWAGVTAAPRRCPTQRTSASRSAAVPMVSG